MKKKFLIVLCFLLLTNSSIAGRLFEYRGSFPAKRNIETTVSNYVLLKKGASVEFVFYQKDSENQPKAIVTKVALTSDSKYTISNKKGIDAFLVPESGIYEVTISPANNLPQDVNFVLSIYEKEMTAEDLKQLEQKTVDLHQSKPQETEKNEEPTKEENIDEPEPELNIESADNDEKKESENVKKVENNSTAEDDDLLFGSMNNNEVNDVIKKDNIIPLKELPTEFNYVLQNSFAALENENDKVVSWPHDICWAKDGTIWVLDSQRRRVMHYTIDGKSCGAFGSKGVIKGELGLPSALTNVENNLYVSDYSNHAIHVFDSAGIWIKSIKSDKKNGLNITFPGGICLRHDEMWVPDKASSGILCFDLNGVFLGTFESTRESPIESPLCVRANDKYLFIMQENGVLKVFNPMGVLEKSINTECGEILGFDTDPWGGFWVCDGASGVVKRLEINGKQQFIISSPEHLDEEWLPTSISVRTDGKIAITDANNKMVHVFSIK